MAAGCSPNWCSWREGKPATPLSAAEAGPLRDEALVAAQLQVAPFVILGQDSVPLTAVRRMLTENNRVVRTMDEEFQRMRRSILVRAAAHLARRWDRLSGKCSWHEGKPATPLSAAEAGPLRDEALVAAQLQVAPFAILGRDSVPSGLTAVRRMLTENNRVVRTMDEEFQRMRRSILVRAAAQLARWWDRLSGKTEAARSTELRNRRGLERKIR